MMFGATVQAAATVVVAGAAGGGSLALGFAAWQPQFCNAIPVLSSHECL
jgi:hypothetical protein